MDNQFEQCAPSKKYTNGSCLSLESLIKITEAYNNKIVPKKKESNIPMIYNKRYLVKELHNRLKDVCNDQLCWIKQDFVKELNDTTINKNTFRPKGPANSLKWLNTFDINDVINQYCEIYKDFRFFGAVPIDFDKLDYLGINKLDYDKLCDEGIHKIGFVFNLDEHWQSGSHWVGMYANILTGEVYFFDSYGTPPENRIKILIDRIGNYYKNKTNKNPIIKSNNVRHQYKNSECGVYSTSFILRLLKDETFDNIIHNIVDDDTISKCRKVYFN
jgi:hypothetical protein